MPKKLLDAVALNAERTPEQRQEYARRAGLASGAARRKRRAMRDVLSQYMTAKVTAPDLIRFLEEAQIGADDRTYETAIAMSAIVKASRGDIEASRYVRDTLGEKPTEAYQIAMSDKPIKALDLSGMSDEELQALADQADG